MPSRFGLVGTATSLLLAAAVVTAAPAEARRNIGGSVPLGSDCITPAKAQLDNPNGGPPCICVLLPDRSVVRTVGKGPDKLCAPGIVKGL